MDVSEKSAVAGVSTQWPERLWVVRHGQSSGNVARDVAEAHGHALIDLEHRDADVPLSALGERQAHALGKWMSGLPQHERPTVVLCSPYVRARQTATAVVRALGHGDDLLSIDERLREKEFGVLDRYTTAGILATFPELAEQRKLVGKFYFRPPGGESWCDVIFRLRAVVGDLQRNHVGARVLIVGHQVIVNCFRYLAERMDEATILGIDREGEVPNCGVTEYVAGRDGQALQLVRTNFVSPELADEPVTTESDRPAGAR
ncbi:histidine phosphatase family protein [Xanthomonas hydrangeae]|uniref:Histidine phosphatase family protein n=1 Tax=Xanthomonas hydrangeae TaxID=2775159 RepID=A0AAU0B772_9XANT|nr:histidine phosphatase family protein [Xanthomonas hydrangeae]WOB48534.1 histidine phosphatase family protein [Xanthomonas hydrangeae]